MASTRELVSFPGRLKGEGHDATCTVWATRVSLPGSSAVADVHYSIKDVSAPLPDGSYEVLVNGEAIPVTRRDGDWIAGPQ
jgi:hypothetical protein